MELSRHEADIDAQVSSLASLGEPIRRSLYRFVVGQPEPVSREQAAAGVQVAHHIAKFHLDKLEEDGLLEVEYRRPAGRTGPGAGRPTKLYRRAERDISVSLPERRYDLAGHLMAEAISLSTATGDSVSNTLHTAAHKAGQALAEDVVDTLDPAPSSASTIAAVCEVLDANGYQPKATARCITLTNCPFHSLAENYTELVCGMNLDVITGLVDGLGTSGLKAQLDPGEERCCVTVAITPRTKQR